ncbi:hypothetical protein BE08_06265 [Sorangium cellulosum]|uniref:Uncharacterized protein n=1 Tax=Sorangium cellulosum TaxID=56 RepID=A0A150PSG4_SORCE|nr:hypothetical protein BE08_06265 [Sorangium cellulosum]
MSRDPPGSTNDRSGARSSWQRSISASSAAISACVTRGCFGWTSSGSVARIEPRLKSSCCTRSSVRPSSPSRSVLPAGAPGKSSISVCRAAPISALSSSTVP